VTLPLKSVKNVLYLERGGEIKRRKSRKSTFHSGREGKTADYQLKSRLRQGIFLPKGGGKKKSKKQGPPDSKKRRPK